MCIRDRAGAGTKSNKNPLTKLIIIGPPGYARRAAIKAIVIARKQCASEPLNKGPKTEDEE